MNSKTTAAKKTSHYVSRQPDSRGNIDWPDEDHRVWHDLVARQRQNLPGRACDEYLHGLALLDFPADRIPQLEEVN